VSEKDLGDAKTGIVLTDLVTNYKAEGFLFDRLVVESSIGEVYPKGFRMFHRVSTKDNRLIALAEVGVIGFNYKKRGLAKLPEQFLSSCAKLMVS
jgi:acyl-CoA thioesterase FadM